jgi:hypothetical protein
MLKSQAAKRQKRKKEKRAKSAEWHARSVERSPELDLKVGFDARGRRMVKKMRCECLKRVLAEVAARREIELAFVGVQITGLSRHCCGTSTTVVRNVGESGCVGLGRAIPLFRNA